MQSLSHVLRKAVAAKNLHTTGYLGIIFRAISGQYEIEELSGYIKHGILFLRIAEHGKRMRIFHEKRTLLASTMHTLTSYGYKVKITDIRFL